MISKIEDNNTAPIIFMFPFYARLKSLHIFTLLDPYQFSIMLCSETALEDKHSWDGGEGIPFTAKLQSPL